MKKKFFAIFTVLLMILSLTFCTYASAQYDYGYNDYNIYDYYDYDNNDYDDGYDSENSSDNSFNWGSSILVAVVIGLVAAGVTTGIMYSQLKNVKHQTRAENYVVSGSMNVTAARDLFLYQHTTRVARPKKNK